MRAPGHAGLGRPVQAAAATCASPAVGSLLGQQPLLETPSWSWADALRGSLLSVAVAGSLLLSGALPAAAENELAALANSKSTSELVDPQCFSKHCRAQTEACVDNPDCTKGLVCSAKCMGDAECTVGCFARYGNKALDDVLSCTIEDAGCIKIALMEPGSDSPLEAPLPPKPIIPVSRTSMEGTWYKVMGWNPKYDCFDCQCNSFEKPGAREMAATIGDGGDSSMSVQVDFSMPRVREGAPPERFSQTLHETIEFDSEPGSHRTAHTQGKMFGLTFWENWYLIGENKPAVEPPFKFVYYTGKTLQNRYEGAFVYARKPELPRDAMPHIYKLAREAGMDPTRFCAIDNGCFAGQPTEGPAADEKRSSPLFTPVAQAAEVRPRQLAAADAAPAAAAHVQPSPISRARRALIDLSEYIEDPKPSAAALFGKQKQMYQVREYDPEGHRVPASGAALAVAEPVSAVAGGLNVAPGVAPAFADEPLLERR